MCVQLARAEVDYHRRSLEMLEQLVPQLEEAVGKWCHINIYLGRAILHVFGTLALCLVRKFIISL